MRASIRQVAQRAGVSPSTVSNVLRSRPEQMAVGTRERVLQAIRDLNYVPVRPAVQNRHVETRAIGVVFLEDMRGVLGLRTFAGMRDRAQERGYDLLVILRAPPDWMAPGTEAQFLDRRCDGFIFVGHGPLDVMATLVRHGVPTVACYHAAPPAGVATVLPDGAAGMGLAVEHLIARGHERIGHLAGPRQNTEAGQRRDGFRAAMRARGLDRFADCVFQGETWGADEKGERPDPRVRPLAEGLFAAGVTAVVCGNDFLALDLWRIAEERGLRVPGELSLTGMDDMDVAARRGLTSVINPFHAVGEQAVDTLLLLLQGGDYRQASRLVPVELIARESVSPP